MLIPLFPLNLVAFPTTALPLHIFEEKYKAMIEYCMKENFMFGIILSQSNAMSRTGCAMSVAKVFQTYDDGRSDILASGRYRFRIRSIDTSEVYLRGDVEFFDDEPEENDIDELVSETLDAYRVYLKKFHPNKAEYYQVFFEEQYQQISFRMASAITGEQGFKQSLLESLSEEERLAELKQYFSSRIKASRSDNPFVRQLQQEHNFSNN